MNIALLRERISRIEGAHAAFAKELPGRTPAWQFGIPEIDRSLPGAALSCETLHDFTPDGPTDVPSVSALLWTLLQRLPRQGPVLWCQTAHGCNEFGRPYGPGLMDGGVGPQRLVFVSLEKPRLMVFALEEALKTPHLAAVLGEGPPLAFTETRRLSLIARKTGVPCLFINTQNSGEASAAVTRWKIGPLSGPARPHDGRAPGALAWRLELTRSRSGKSGSWEVFWNDDTHSFDTLSTSGHGSLRQGQFSPQPVSNVPTRATG